jgi:hypothetical protein
MSATVQKGGFGLLAAMMEPPPDLEAEFQDWYDLEHFPERESLDGVLAARRLVCVEGWPRYLALYDLNDLEVLRGPGYAAIAGANYSRWTGRIIPRVTGHYRAEAQQIWPGRAAFGAVGPAARVALWRFRGLAASAEGDLLRGLHELYGEFPETVQLRVFRCAGAGGDYLATVELSAPLAVPAGAAGRLGAALRHVDMVNHYVPYFRA